MHRLLVLLIAPLLLSAGCWIASDSSNRSTAEPVIRIAVGERTATPAPTALQPTQPPAATVPVRTVTPTLAAVAASITPTVQTAPPGGATYEVQSGDTLFGLSRRFGVSVADLASLNRMPADGGLRAGQDFQLPPGVWSNQLNIRVTRPARGAAVGSPVLVEGTASTFESVVQVEILAADGTRLAQASTRANAPDTGRHGPFQVSLPVAGAPDGRSATVRVFWSSPRDGAPLDEVRIPISLSG